MLLSGGSGAAFPELASRLRDGVVLLFVHTPPRGSGNNAGRDSGRPGQFGSGDGSANTFLDLVPLPLTDS